MNGKCEDCKWWDDYDEEAPSLGKCHKYAPKSTNYDDGLARHVYCEWPDVVEDDWCGEFEAKGESDETT